VTSEILISHTLRRDADAHSLSAALRSALPDSEPLEDRERVYQVVGSRDAWSRFEQRRERRRKRQRQRELDEDVNRMGLLAPAIVELVLPAVSAATAQTAVGAVVSWLRGLRGTVEGDTEVLIFGPRGEPLQKVSLRRGWFRWRIQKFSPS
jgi:hypothetical protein